MQSVREIRARIRRVRSTQQITKAMKMVSVAKLRRIQSSMADAGQYADTVRSMLQGALSAGVPADHPLLTPRREVRNQCYVLFSGDRGLCGTYHQDLLRFAQDVYNSCTCPAYFLAVGRMGGEMLRRAELPVRDLPVSCGDVPTPREARALAAYIKQLYLAGEADRIILVYQQYRSALQQEPTSLCLLPAVPEDTPVERAYIFEPSAGAVLDRLVEADLEAQVYSVLRQSRMGEHAARLNAMRAASDATDELIGHLELALNRARQGAITAEITEIAGGAEALRGNEE